MVDFKKSVVYQVYPKSFYDSNGDGFGDLRGVTEKLPYIENLGANYIWMTPFFVSPQKDNGYDIADYYNVDERFGTMEDLELLIENAKKCHIKIMLDMVFNHVSTEHEWFKKAVSGDEKYKDYFIFKKGKANGEPPTNWKSKFGGSAWEYVPKYDEYYLHVCDVSQADLNCDNPEVRKELQNVLRFWIAKGIKGFRFDVINLVSKGEFLDDLEWDGRKYYTDGPHIHDYIRELNEATFGTDTDIITVGEMSNTNINDCYKYAGENTNELNMVFNFHHMKVDYVDNEKWVLVPFDFEKLKAILFEWQTKMSENNAWNAAFWCNHDQPRVVSRFGDEGKYHTQSAKMLATVIQLLRSTPFIYQGEEIGMTNANFTDISQYRDIESLNNFQILKDKGLSEKNAYAILAVHSRDPARTPLQWSDEAGAGFIANEGSLKNAEKNNAVTEKQTKTGTWISENSNYNRINVQSQVADESSIFSHYKKLIALRKQLDVVAYGDIMPLEQNHPSVFAYKRTYKDETLVVINNFYAKPTIVHVDVEEIKISAKTGIDKDISTNAEIDKDNNTEDFECILSNYEARAFANELELRPYESLVFYRGGRIL
jgi:trehalose-6-phosphate hydrolase